MATCRKHSNITLCCKKRDIKIFNAVIDHYLDIYLTYLINQIQKTHGFTKFYAFEEPVPYFKAYIKNKSDLVATSTTYAVLYSAKRTLLKNYNAIRYMYNKLNLPTDGTKMKRDEALCLIHSTAMKAYGYFDPKQPGIICNVNNQTTFSRALTGKSIKVPKIGKFKLAESLIDYIPLDAELLCTVYQVSKDQKTVIASFVYRTDPDIEFIELLRR